MGQALSFFFSKCQHQKQASRHLGGLLVGCRCSPCFSMNVVFKETKVFLKTMMTPCGFVQVKAAFC